ncbi:MAG: hypothetical protein BAJALOKI3v1_320041 [Promethearchaeota archaeon]|nr:MAG: hypothetical protein BAJALOKI3v1_320041 [Candidatus Lokiarchaeota archaeon]
MDFFEEVRDSILRADEIDDLVERNKKIEQIISDSIDFAQNLTHSNEYYEAGELLFSVAELLEDIAYSRTLELYEKVISHWESQINLYQMQGKLHEISELYLRIAEIYGEKLKKYDLERSFIFKSIRFLKQESDLLLEFNEGRKLAQNYQNIAELYLKVNNFEKAIEFYRNVIKFAKELHYFDILSYSYKQISLCYEELDDFKKAKDIILDAIDFFRDLYSKFKKKNENLAVAQICQILKNLYHFLEDEEQFIFFSKREAGAYINVAEELAKKEKNYYKIARYYRGAALCYKDIQENLIEAASCFVLAANYSEKIGDYNQTAINNLDAAKIFKKLRNHEFAYKHFMKAGDHFWKAEEYNKSTESYLNAYDISVEGKLEYNRYGLFNQIIRGLSMIAKQGLQNKQFYTAATLILESIKFYEQLDTAKDFLLKEMIKNTYKYYYRAANLKKVGYSHIVHSYVLASLSLIHIGNLERAREIISEIEPESKTIKDFKRMIDLIIKQVSEGQEVSIGKLPFKIQRLIQTSDDIKYLINLFRRL